MQFANRGIGDARKLRAAWASGRFDASAAQPGRLLAWVASGWGGLAGPKAVEGKA